MHPNDLVLVCILPSPRDLELARVLGWYRIPYTKAPKTITVDHLAFYQTARFGAEKWSINYTAPVLGHELVTRAELLRTEPDHPRANEQYFKIQIGPLERLERPIPSLKWRRLTFVYTTGERLLRATEVNDLIVNGDERELLWTALKEHGLQAEAQYESRRGVEVDFAILCALGNLGVLFENPADGPPKVKDKSGWKYLVVSDEAVRQDVNAVLGQIESAVEQLGGPTS